MNEHDELARRFEENRAHLRVVAYKMLGSRSEADDAVQESWLRLSRADAPRIENLGGWLTTVVAHVCLDMLRSRQSRREAPLDTHALEQSPDPTDKANPEQEALMADSVGLALLVVLETLAPAERLAFVLHDMFAVSFDEIALIVGRTPTATRQLASRARRRVQGATTTADADRARRKEIVDAFLTASRGGDFNALLAVLAPDVVLRADMTAVRMGAAEEIKGATPVAQNFWNRSKDAKPVLVNGILNVVWAPGGKPRVVFHFTITDGVIVAIDLIANPDYLDELDLVLLEDGTSDKEV